MNLEDINKLWRKVLTDEHQSLDRYELLARSMVDLYNTGDAEFRRNFKNRFGRVTERTGQLFDHDNFNLDMSRAFIADELGFTGWDNLLKVLEHPKEEVYPMLFRFAIAAMEMGNFSSLESVMGGADVFDQQIRGWFEAGYFDNEPETLAEIFAAACMLGHAHTAEYLLDQGVDPYAGMKTGLAGFHYAVSSARRHVIRLLIDKRLPMDVKNIYGGTIIEQAFWSAVHEHRQDHAAIIEDLLEAGAQLESGTLEWWEQQNVPSDETKQRVSHALRKRLLSEN